MIGQSAALWVAATLALCDSWRSANAAILLDTGGQAPFREAPGRVIVQLRPDVVAAMDNGSHGLRFKRQAGLPNAAVYSIVDGMDAHEKARELSKLPAVQFAEPDYLVRVNWQPNDVLFKAQWHHSTINSQIAWNASRGSGEIKVCHVDSGARLDHPDLAGRIAAGWNLVPEVQDFDAESPPPDSPAYKDISDTFGHGTHTAGLIAAVGNNMLGVAGVAMQVKLLVCRFIWDDGFGSMSDALECLRLCREAGATVSTNSWGGVPRSKAIDAALKELKKAGMLFVVASGNQGTDLDARPSFPASSKMDNMIVVGSSGRTDEMSSFSNYGKSTVHLLAPGEQILSTTYNKWYGPMDGTSMATPLVAASAALLQSAALSQGVNLAYGHVKRLLLSTVDPAPGKAASATITGGRLNVGAAMQALSLLLQNLGQPGLPGLGLAAADERDLRQLMLKSSWGQELLHVTAGTAQGLLSNSSEAEASSPTPCPPAGHGRGTAQLQAAAVTVEDEGENAAVDQAAEQQDDTAEALAPAPLPAGSSATRRRLKSRMRLSAN